MDVIAQPRELQWNRNPVPVSLGKVGVPGEIHEDGTRSSSKALWFPWALWACSLGASKAQDQPYMASKFRFPNSSGRSSYFNHFLDKQWVGAVAGHGKVRVAFLNPVYPCVHISCTQMCAWCPALVPLVFWKEIQHSLKVSDPSVSSDRVTQLGKVENPLKSEGKLLEPSENWREGPGTPWELKGSSWWSSKPFRPHLYARSQPLCN